MGFKVKVYSERCKVLVGSGQGHPGGTRARMNRRQEIRKYSSVWEGRGHTSMVEDLTGSAVP